MENCSSACVSRVSLPYTQMRTDPTAAPPYSMGALANCWLALAGGASVRPLSEFDDMPAPDSLRDDPVPSSMVTAEESYTALPVVLSTTATPTPLFRLSAYFATASTCGSCKVWEVLYTSSMRVAVLSASDSMFSCV